MDENRKAENVEAKSLFLSKIADVTGKLIAGEFREYGVLAEKWLADRDNDQFSMGATEYAKNDLKGAASLGLLTAVSAEALAKQLQCGALTHKPDYDDFKPMDYADWTLPMAVQWIENRNLNSVTEQIAEFRADWTYWSPFKNRGLPEDGKANEHLIEMGYETKTIRPSNLNDMAYGNISFEKDLWQKLSNDDLKAKGKPNGGVRETIAAHLWQDLKPRSPDSQSLTTLPYTVEWNDVTVGRVDVLRLWPEAPSSLRKAGRVPILEWAMVETETLRLMDHNGEFSADDPTWNSQARLEATLFEFCQTTFDKEPAISTLRGKLKPWLQTWRATKVSN